MYTIRQYTTSVRSLAPRYGDWVDPEPYAGAGVLEDLRGAEAEEIPFVLARYAALRAWTLRYERAPTAVVTHALSAALDHLSAIDGDWLERELLREVLRCGTGRRALISLDAAAAAAEERGHHHGARALREAVHRHRLWGGWLPPPSRS